MMLRLLKKISNRSNLGSSNSSLISLENQYEFKLKVREYRRARRITLRVCQINGEVRITVPRNLDIAVIRNFINSNFAWIQSSISYISPLKPIINGALIPLFGFERKVLVDPKIKYECFLTETMLIVPETKLLLKKHIKKFLIKTATDYFVKNCSFYAEKLGVNFLNISVKDPKARWGSCSSEKKLMFSWRLIMAPVEVSSYVAAHEVAHLVHMDHSKEFWDVVFSVCPKYKCQRDWLKKNGRNLHKFIF